MYLCYVDETGLEGECPVVVTVGVLVEGTQRLVKTNREWAARLGPLLTETGAKMTELKSSRFYRGLGRWGAIPGDERAARIEELLDWFVERKHQIALAAVEKTAMADSAPLGVVRSAELLAALHIPLQVQRAHQGKGNNKGVTLFVMDKSKIEGKLADLLSDPPSWSDNYYARRRRAEPFDQLVHTPFFVQSDRLELVQLADLIAFVYRRYVEVQRDGDSYPGESERLTRWKQKLDTRLLGRSHRLPARGVDAGTAALVKACPVELS